MTLQKRLLITILAAAPFAWLLTLGLTYYRTRVEINELYDTDMVRLAQQVHALLPRFSNPDVPAGSAVGAEAVGDMGYAGLGDIAVAAWLPDGRRLQVDPDGDNLPVNTGKLGFIDQYFEGQPWRLYYVEAADPGGWRVGVGQRLGERDELVYTYLLGQALLWIVGLLVLVAVLVFGVRRALRPVVALSTQIARREPNDPTPMDIAAAPGELRPLVSAMNQLLGRTAQAIENERRLTADAAHELRTPVAALRAQWDAAMRTGDPAERMQAQRNVEAGIERLNHLITQLLDLARLEHSLAPAFKDEIDWRAVVRQALSDCLLLAGRKGIDVEVLWPQAGGTPLPLSGDQYLLTLLLRNLLDNAVRYSPDHATVSVRFDVDAIHVENPGAGVPSEQLERLGDRFFRGAGQVQGGSGLGLSIVRRIAAAHGLSLALANRVEEGRVTGFRATLRRERSEAGAAPDQVPPRLRIRPPSTK